MDSWDPEVDLIAGGFGAAGLPAAIRATATGAEVLLLKEQAEDTCAQNHDVLSGRMNVKRIPST